MAFGSVRLYILGYPPVDVITGFIRKHQACINFLQEKVSSIFLQYISAYYP